jgi:hypothetical protein
VRRFQCEELEVPQKSREVRDTNLDGVSREPEVIRAFKIRGGMGFTRISVICAIGWSLLMTCWLKRVQSLSKSE